MNLTTATPIEIDTVLAELDGQLKAAQHRIDSGREALRRMFSASVRKDYKDFYTEGYSVCRERAERWVSGDEDGIALNRGYVGKSQVERALGSIDTAAAEAERLGAEIAKLDAEYIRRGGWSRFFLVPGGHIHSSLDCSTCNKVGKMTQFGWLPQMSGRTEADVVAEHGALLCTICFPSAPVEWTNFYEEQAAAKKAARCAGSGTYMDHSLPNRTGFYSGNWATCPVCGDRPTVTSTGKLRAHKPKAS